MWGILSGFTLYWTPEIRLRSVASSSGGWFVGGTVWVHSFSDSRGPSKRHTWLIEETHYVGTGTGGEVRSLPVTRDDEGCGDYVPYTSGECNF